MQITQSSKNCEEIALLHDICSSRCELINFTNIFSKSSDANIGMVSLFDKFLKNIVANARENNQEAHFHTIQRFPLVFVCQAA